MLLPLLRGIKWVSSCEVLGRGLTFLGDSPTLALFWILFVMSPELGWPSGQPSLSSLESSWAPTATGRVRDSRGPASTKPVCAGFSVSNFQFQLLICVLSTPPPCPGAFPTTASFQNWEALEQSPASWRALSPSSEPSPCHLSLAPFSALAMGLQPGSAGSSCLGSPLHPSRSVDFPRMLALPVPPPSLPLPLDCLPGERSWWTSLQRTAHLLGGQARAPG